MTMQGRPLTKAQFGLLRLLALTGCSLREAAPRLGYGYDTAKKHASAAYERLGAADRWEAFIALGWLRPESIPDVWMRFDVEPVPVTGA